MKITANSLTLLRILLLPLPCLLLYGGPEAKITALGVGSLLGLTDYFDGRLARRQGVTRLGTLLDPIADKIFVAVLYLVLSQLGYLPFFLVAFILLREFLVTALRQIFSGALAVSWLAKTKTAIQMLGAALLVLIKTFPAQSIFIVLFGALGLALGARFSSLAAGPKKKIYLFAILFSGLAFLSPPTISLVLGGVILFITWSSAAPYLKEAFRRLELSSFKEILARILLPSAGLLLVPQAGNLWPLALLLLVSEFIREALALVFLIKAPPRFWTLLGALGLIVTLFEEKDLTVAYLGLASLASLCEIGKTLLETAFSQRKA